MLRPRSFATPPRIAFMKLTEDAELSPTKPTFVGFPAPDLVARSTIRGSSAVAWVSAVGEVWKMYLNPRPVIKSEYDSVSDGNSARSVTSASGRVTLADQHAVLPTTPVS